MPQLGQFHALTVTELVDFGLFLDGGEMGDILLPKKEVDDNTEIGDELEVFLYLDSKDRPIATRRTPKIELGKFAKLKCVDVNRIGGFLDWGLEKDLLVPFAEQNQPMEVGKSYLVCLYLDNIDNRLTASTKLDRFLQDENNKTFAPSQEVELIIANQTDLGTKAIVNHSHWGLIFKDDVTRPVRYGEVTKGFIKQVRGDGRLNISLEKTSQIRDKQSQQILDFLEREGGFANIHDKSDPKLIRKLFGISKSAFKKAIGGLYKRGDIVIETTGIRVKK